MWSLLQLKSQPILGIDISSSSIKILQLSVNTEGHCKVEGHSSVALPEAAFEGANVKEIDVVADAIRKAFSTAHSTSKLAVIAMPDSTAISKIIQISEGLSEADIEELVIIEAEKYIPYPIEEVNIDFSLLGSSSKNSALQDLLIVASRAENVNTRVEAVRRAGLETKVVDVESFAIERAAPLFIPNASQDNDNKIVAIIDLGSTFTHVYILRNMRIIYSREEQYGGKQLIESITQSYEMKLHEATDALISNNLPSNFITDILQPFNEQLLLQIKRALQFFYSMAHHQSVDHIFVVGGLSRQCNIIQFLQDKLGIPISIGNPLASMSFSNGINKEKLLAEAPAYVVACGLAMRQVD